MRGRTPPIFFLRERKEEGEGCVLGIKVPLVGEKEFVRRRASSLFGERKKLFEKHNTVWTFLKGKPRAPYSGKKTSQQKEGEAGYSFAPEKSPEKGGGKNACRNQRGPGKIFHFASLETIE